VSKDAQELERYIGRLVEDFPFFCEELWVAVGLPKLAKHQHQIGKWLQQGPRRRGVRAFRGASKTWVTLAFCLWRLFRNPNERIMLVSKTEKHSRDSLYMVRSWIDKVPWLSHLSPQRTEGHRDSATQFDIATAPSDRVASFSAYGIGGQITGGRATMIIADDVETSQNTLTLDMRQRLREEVKEFENILIPGGDIIFLGTPHHEETLYDKLVEGGYVFQSWPARYPKADEPVPSLAEDMKAELESGARGPGDCAWPERFDNEDLLEREAAEGRSTFAMQYMMITHLGEGNRYPLKLRDVIVFPIAKDKAPVTISWGMTNDHGRSTRCEDVTSLGFGIDAYHAPIFWDSEWAGYTGCRMWIDPSGKGADKTAYAIVAHLNGYLWVKAVGGFDGGYEPEVLEGLAYQAQLHGAGIIHVEDNFGTGMFARLLEPVIAKRRKEGEGWGASIEPVRVSGQKELRIITTLEPLFNQHRIVFHPDVARNEELQRQLTRITRLRNCLRHDDEIDALAMCCKMWQDEMQTDPLASSDNAKLRWFKRQLDEHMEASGLFPSQPRWFKH
jgi:hypothetical protein